MHIPMLHISILLFFLLQGSLAAETKVVVVPLGSAIGDATVGDVLEGKTFSSKEGAGLTGTMPGVGGQDITPGTSDQTITKGYHEGTGVVIGDADLVAVNIKYGKNIFGIEGTSECITISTISEIMGPCLLYCANSFSTSEEKGACQWGCLQYGTLIDSPEYGLLCD